MEEQNLQVEVAELKKLNGDTKTKAFVDISVNNAILIKGLRVVSGSKGLFVGLPGRQAGDGKWYNSVMFLDEEVKNQVTSVVLNAYENDQP